MSDGEFHIRPCALGEEQSGELLAFTRESAGWEWMSFSVQRLATGETWATEAREEEIGFVLLSGRCAANWGVEEMNIGERASVFDGFPYAIYVTRGDSLRIRALTVCEFAVCR